jgi:4-hydroxy-3-methylbut-2-enyl diphosphate reductase
MSVWKRVRQYRERHQHHPRQGLARGNQGHRLAGHQRKRRRHYLVVFTLAETDYVCDYIRKGGNKEEFLKKFEGAYSPASIPTVHLVSVGVANQTTMMRGETEEVQRRFEQAMVDRYGREISTSISARPTPSAARRRNGRTRFPKCSASSR